MRGPLVSLEPHACGPRRDVIVSLLAWVLVLQRSERLQRVGQLLDVLVFVPATLPVVWNVAKYPLRGLSVSDSELPCCYFVCTG